MVCTHCPLLLLGASVMRTSGLPILLTLRCAIGVALRRARSRRARDRSLGCMASNLHPHPLRRAQRYSARTHSTCGLAACSMPKLYAA